MRLPGLREQRQLRYWSQGDLGRRAGVSRVTIVAIEAGKECTPRVGQAISLALELSPVTATSRALQEAST